MDSLVIDAEAVLPFSRGAKYMDNHPSAVPANARKKGNEGKERATGAPNAAKLITGRAYTPIKRDRGEVDSATRGARAPSSSRGADASAAPIAISRGSTPAKIIVARRGATCIPAIVRFLVGRGSLLAAAISADRAKDPRDRCAALEDRCAARRYDIDLLSETNDDVKRPSSVSRRFFYYLLSARQKSIPSACD